VSADGRYLAFTSDAPNLVGGDTNNTSDIFFRDRITKQTRRVSVGVGGAQANGPSYSPAVSADGRFVAFVSEADNLVAGDTNQVADVFVRDLAAGVTTRVSVDSANPAVQGNGPSYEPSLSADGSKVSFTSEASNLAAGDTNGVADVFVRDRAASVTSRVSIASGVAGAQGNDASGQSYLSSSGQIVAFISRASTLVAGDTNNAFDVFVRDRTANTTARVSVVGASTQANKDSWQPSLSGDGRYVVFASDASNLVAADSNGVADIFLRDRTANATARLSVDGIGGQSDGPSYNPAISNDGRYVAFDSLATLDAADYNGMWDIYLRDRTSTTTTRVSVSTTTLEGNGDSRQPAMSSDGRYVLFESFASNLESGDTNNAWDIFVRDRGVGTTPSYPLLTVPGK
jgi:Tol biopolymer transport system component